MATAMSWCSSWCSSSSWPCMAVATVALLLLPVAVARWRGRKARAQGAGGATLPPGTLGWPFIGETPEFVACMCSPRPESFIDKRRLLYGGKVFKSNIWGGKTILTTEPEVSKAVLQGDGKVFVPWYPKSLMILMGESSILVINSALQRRVHGLIGSLFKSPQLKEQVTADMQRQVQAAVASWRRLPAAAPGAAGHLIRVQDEAKSIVFQILVKGLIGLEPGEEMEYLKQQFREFISGLMCVPIKLPGTTLYKSLQAKKRMAKLIQKIIKDKRGRILDGEELCGAPRDAVAALINCGGEMTDELISDNMIDFMIPAEDSVPVLITLAIKYLSECPLAFQQLEEENMQLKQQKSDAGETLQWSDYMSLSFTQQVISETLRLGNIITGIMRKATRDVEIKGYLIPKGWRVFVYFRSVHLDDAFYDEPYKFNPWRWKGKDAVNTTSSSCFTPFGGGQRLCPGLDAARLEASIFLHHLITNFRWVAEDDQIVNFPTVRVKGGMPIRITSRI